MRHSPIQPQCLQVALALRPKQAVGTRIPKAKRSIQQRRRECDQAVLLGKGNGPVQTGTVGVCVGRLRIAKPKGEADERKVLERTVQAGRCYLMDRGYAKYTLWNAIATASDLIVVAMTLARSD